MRKKNACISIFVALLLTGTAACAKTPAPGPADATAPAESLASLPSLSAPETDSSVASTNPNDIYEPPLDANAPPNDFLIALERKFEKVARVIERLLQYKDYHGDEAYWQELLEWQGGDLVRWVEVTEEDARSLEEIRALFDSFYTPATALARYTRFITDDTYQIHEGKLFMYNGDATAYPMEIEYDSARYDVKTSDYLKITFSCTLDGAENDYTDTSYFALRRVGGKWLVEDDNEAIYHDD